MAGIVPAFFYTAGMQAKPKNPWNPERLDVRALAQAGASLSAREPLARFPRLKEECHPEGGPDDAQLVWQARGEVRSAGALAQPSVWLHLQAQLTLPLTADGVAAGAHARGLPRIAGGAGGRGRPPCR